METLRMLRQEVLQQVVHLIDKTLVQEMAQVAVVVQDRSPFDIQYNEGRQYGKA
jgi:hypothetical protein